MNVKVLREALGISSDQLAQMLRASQKTINNWESGRHQPSPYYTRELFKLVEEIQEACNTKSP